MNVYERLGVTPIINASGSVTRLGGAPMPPEVLQAFTEAATQAVSIEELQAAASAKIADLTGAESGLVTAGCASALTLGAAAIIAQYDLGKMEKLPHCDDFRNEFVIAREQRSGYDHAVRASGARLVEVGCNEIVANAGVRRTEPWEYEAAFGPKTAGVVFVFGRNTVPWLGDVVERAHRHGYSVLVDAAAEVPPRSNFEVILSTGVDLVCFSGGKAIRGPQSTGILCGRRDLVASAALQMLDMDEHLSMWEPPAKFIDKEKIDGLPRHGLGRGMKVSKEEIAALLTALDLFCSGAYDAEVKTFRGYLETIADAVTNKPARTEILDDDDGETPPNLEIHLDEAALGRTAFEVCQSLRHGDPRVYVSHARLSSGTLVIRPGCLTADGASHVARRLAEELSR